MTNTTQDYDLVGTCGYCDRQFTANCDTLLARHGYTRQWGMEMGSCKGSGLPALEKDPVTLDYLIADLEYTIEQGEKAAEKLPAALEELRAHNLTITPEMMINHKAFLETPDGQKQTKLNSRHDSLEQATRYGRYATSDLKIRQNDREVWKPFDLVKRPKEKPVDPDRCPGSGAFSGRYSGWHYCPECKLAFKVTTRGNFRTHKRPK